MDCTHHSGTAAAAICTRCDQPLCTACSHERNSRNFCAGCAEFLDQRSTGRRPATASEPSPNMSPPVPQAAGFAAGNNYQSPPPSGGIGQTPGDVYQGESDPNAAPLGDVYPGDVYPGDVYPGDAHNGSPSDAPITIRLSEEAKERGSTGRGMIWGLVVGSVAALVWYWAVILTQYQFGFLAIAIGWLVGAATTAGAGGGGSRIALLSLVLAACAMIGGDYMINDHYYRKFTTIEIQEAAAFNDGDISNEDIALYFESSIPEMQAELSSEEIEELREFIAAEVSTESGYGAAESEQPAHLPLSQLPFWMGWWEFAFIGIGAVQAFRVPMGDDVA